MEKQTLREWRLNESVANQIEYKKAIGSVQYATTICQQDISYATRKLARYAENPLLLYWVEVQLIPQYSRGTVMIQLGLHNGSKGLTG